MQKALWGFFHSRPDGIWKLSDLFLKWYERATFVPNITGSAYNIVHPGQLLLLFTASCTYHYWGQIRSWFKKNQGHTRYKIKSLILTSCSEPVWPSGKALGWKVEGPQFESASALLSLQKLWSVNTVLLLCPSQLWNIKMALIAAHLNAEVILVVTV